MNIYTTLDSGEREKMPTGSQRDTQEGKPRYDLIGIEGLERLAGLMARGAKKYGPNNWRLGQPSTRYFASLLRHVYQWAAGDNSEDHMAGVVFNAFGIMHIEGHEKFKDLLDHERYTSTTTNFMNDERLNIVHTVVADYQVTKNVYGGTTDMLYSHFNEGATSDDNVMSRDMFADTLIELENRSRILVQHDGFHPTLWQAANTGVPSSWTPDYNDPHATYCNCEKCEDERSTDD